MTESKPRVSKKKITAFCLSAIIGVTLTSYLAYNHTQQENVSKIEEFSFQPMVDYNLTAHGEYLDLLAMSTEHQKNTAPHLDQIWCKSSKQECIAVAKNSNNIKLFPVRWSNENDIMWDASKPSIIHTMDNNGFHLHETITELSMVIMKAALKIEHDNWN